MAILRETGTGPTSGPKAPVPKPKITYKPVRGRGEDTTALDKMTPAQRRSLTEGAQRIASMIPVVMDDDRTGWSGEYAPAGYKNTSPGVIHLKPGSRLISGDDPLMHETLHAFDSMNSGRPSQAMSALTNEQRMRLSRLYAGNPRGLIAFVKGLFGGPAELSKSLYPTFGAPRTEIYAAGGQSGQVAPDLKKYYESFYK